MDLRELPTVAKLLVTCLSLERQGYATRAAEMRLDAFEVAPEVLGEERGGAKRFLTIVKGMSWHAPRPLQRRWESCDERKDCSAYANGFVVAVVVLVTAMLWLQPDTRVALYVAPFWFGLLGVAYSQLKPQPVQAVV